MNSNGNVPIEPQGYKEPQGEGKTDHGPEHVAPRNPNYSSSFDESGGTEDIPLREERETGEPD